MTIMTGREHGIVRDGIDYTRASRQAFWKSQTKWIIPYEQEIGWMSDFEDLVYA